MAAGDPLGGDAREGGGRTRQPWRFWKFPVQFGAGFAALQLLVLATRFGPSSAAAAAQRGLLPFGSGLVVFFIAGTLAGLFVQRLLRRAAGWWRRFLLVAIALATPTAVWFSLVGGLFGPPGVVLYGLVPYLVLAGFPALVRAVWLRLARDESRPVE